jgi:hypothetical protein
MRFGKYSTSIEEHEKNAPTPIVDSYGKSNCFILVQFANPPSPIDVRLYKFSSSIKLQLQNP